MTAQDKLTCDLCGMPISGAPVVGEVGGETHHFCCAGCARAYERAHDENLLERVQDAAPAKRPAFTDVILDRGDTGYLSVEGMWCAGCAVAAEKVLRSHAGVKDADVSFAAERGRIRYDPQQTDLDAVLRDLDRLGYRARLLSDPGQRRVERLQQRTLLQLIVAAAFGMQVMILYFVRLYPLYAAGDFSSLDVRRVQYLVWLLATPALFIGGSSILRGAWRALRARTATMDTLVALGTLAAYGYSSYIAVTGGGEVYFDSVVMITTFIMLGRYLEAVGGSQARKDIRHLLRLQPESARRQSGGTWAEVPAAKLQVGDLILVRPGERVPADATIVAGTGALEEALLSGESAPVEKGPGDTIYAGTILADAALTATVQRPPAASRLAQITRLVDETLATKPPIQRLADRASAYFAAGILAAALLTGIGWSLAGYPPAQALLAAVAVLVVACPCALGLATPLALTVTLGRTTQAGILVRNAAALETAARVSHFVFDKTGTLTRGAMSVTAVVPGGAGAADDLLGMAAAVEQYSEHPIGRAIVAAYGRAPARAAAFSSERGRGAAATLNGKSPHEVRVGSAAYLRLPRTEPLLAQAEGRAQQGETVVWVGEPGGAAGYIALGDELNPTAAAALRDLGDLGITPVLLSGDNPQTTAAIAAALGLDDYEGGCPPEEKAARIKQWQAQGAAVGMAGDGVNDAPALAQADLSVTVAGGTDVAGETSDVVLTTPDLTLVPWFVRRSRRTRRIIVENLGWAFAYNLIAVPLAAFGIISPVIAAAAMAGSSLLVVGNSLRLRGAARRDEKFT